MTEHDTAMPDLPQTNQLAPTDTEAPAPAPANPQPGPRAARLQQLYAQSLRRTLSQLRYENLAACYPTIASGAEPVLRQVQAQMVDKLADKCEKEFDNIVAARGVVAKLNELEALIADASRRRASGSVPPVPPHLLPANDILTAHLLPFLASHQSHLNARLQTVQSRNALLFEEITRQREEVDALAGELEDVVGDVRAANRVLGGVVDEIAREARDVDAHAQVGVSS